MSTSAPKKSQGSKVDNAPAADIFTRVDAFFEKRQFIIFLLCLALSLLFGIWLFDGRLTFSTDDSTYVGNAMSVIQNHAYPTFQGALYPFFLALMIKLFGLKLLMLKACSLVFQLIAVFVFYRSFKGRIPGFLLFCGMITLSTNAFILAYASGTYTESFFIMFQGLSMWSVFMLLDKIYAPEATLRNTLKYWAVLGFCFLLLSLAKNVAMLAPAALVLFFAFRKEWKNLALALLFIIAFKGAYEVAIRGIFKNVANGQAEMLLRKRHNDPKQGYADASDFIDRFTENYGNYISVHTFKMLGFRGPSTSSLYSSEKIAVEPIGDQKDKEKLESNPLLSVLFLVLYILALWMSYKHNKYLFYVFLYVGVMSGVTFLSLQTYWNQDRLMIIYLPFLFMAMVYGVHAFLRERKLDFIQPFVLLLAGICILLQLIFTFNRVQKQSRLYGHALKGDKYYGYEGERVNYLATAEWTIDNTPKGSIIAASKPAEAKVFGKSLNFQRINMPNSQDPDSVLNALRTQHFSYLLMDAAFGGTPIAAYNAIKTKYPDKLKIVHTEGDVDNGAAALIEIKY